MRPLHKTLCVLAVLLCSLCFAVSAFAQANRIVPTSYDMPNGNTGSYHYWDDTYTGSGSTTTDNAPLSGGRGDLTDGIIASDNWYVTEASNHGPYVGWEIDPTITFHFATVCDFKTVRIYFDDSDGYGGVSAPRGVNINGVFYPVSDPPGSAPFFVDFDISGKTPADTLVIQLLRNNSWVFASEFQFTGVQQTGLQLGVADQRTWVGNTNEFTANIKNTGITPQTLSSAAITGTPWATLLSAPPTAPLQPGDQIQLTYRLTVPTTATGGGAASPVLIPVSLDVVSNGLKFSEPFQIQLYQNPVTQVVTTVLDDVTHASIPNALVALDNSANLYQTDQNGHVTVNVAPGTRTVYGYAPGHLSAQSTVLISQGALASATLSLPQGQALQVSNVVATPLTLAQIQARGINLSDPSNFFIYDFVVKMRIGDATAPSVIIPAHPAPGSSISGSFGGGSGGGGGGGGNFGGGGGIGGFYTFTFPTGDPTVRVETWIIIEGDIRVLKQFWDATVFINNNTSLPINGVQATLNVPTGLSLPPLFGQAQPLMQNLGSIAPMRMTQAQWVVRGDVAGVYQLLGTATGTLALGGGGVPLASTLRSNPITVVAPRLGVAFETPDAVVAGENFTLGIDITNESAIDLTEALVHLKSDRLVNCVLAAGQADTVDLGGIAIGETKHVNLLFTSLVTGRVLDVQTYVSPDPEIAPNVTVNAQKVKAVNDTAATVANTLVNIPVLTNDAADTTLSVASATNGAHGAVTTNGLQAIYTPSPGFIGTDYFTYTAQDTQGNVGTANVAVTVGSVTPTISGTNPGSSVAGTAGFNLTVNGSGFDATTQATWNGAARATAFISPTQLQVTLLTSDLAAAGLNALEVSNAGAGSAVSSYAVYNVSQGAPVLSATIGALSRDGVGNILVPVSIANTGLSDALNAGFSAATLRAGAGLLNVTPASSLGAHATIFVGTTQQFTLVFPASAGVSGAAAVLQLTFGAAGSAPQGRSQRLALP